MSQSGAYNKGVRHDKQIKPAIVAREKRRKAISEAEAFAKQVMGMML